jgi:flavodoxin
LVLYESKIGNIEEIAQSIHQAIGGEIHNLADFKPEMLDDIDLLVVGSPLHGWHPSAETVRFLNYLETGSLKGKFVAAFDTGFKIYSRGMRRPEY